MLHPHTSHSHFIPLHSLTCSPILHTLSHRIIPHTKPYKMSIYPWSCGWLMSGTTQPLAHVTRRLKVPWVSFFTRLATNKKGWNTVISWVICWDTLTTVLTTGNWTFFCAQHGNLLVFFPVTFLGRLKSPGYAHFVSVMSFTRKV